MENHTHKETMKKGYCSEISISRYNPIAFYHSTDIFKVRSSLLLLLKYAIYMTKHDVQLI